MDCNLKLWVGWVPGGQQSWSLKRHCREHTGALAFWTAQRCKGQGRLQISEWDQKRCAIACAANTNEQQLQVKLIKTLMQVLIKCVTICSTFQIVVCRAMSLQISQGSHAEPCPFLKVPNTGMWPSELDPWPVGGGIQLHFNVAWLKHQRLFPETISF